LSFQLRQKDITKVVVAGMIANHCIEATARYAFDLYVLLASRLRAEIG
jgi:nicotinamidase-related amidase